MVREDRLGVTRTCGEPARAAGAVVPAVPVEPPLPPLPLDPPDPVVPAVPVDGAATLNFTLPMSSVPHAGIVRLGTVPCDRTVEPLSLVRMNRATQLPAGIFVVEPEPSPHGNSETIGACVPAAAFDEMTTATAVAPPADTSPPSSC